MIRETLKSDMESVCSVIQLAFASEDPAGNDHEIVPEVLLVRDLIKDEDVLINLVYEIASEIVGNVVVSNISLDPNKGLYCGGVAPLSVMPRNQSLGVGGSLMRKAVNRGSRLGLDALFLLGDPVYYSRFGFQVSNLANEYSNTHFQELEIREGCLAGLSSKVSYAPAFAGL